MARREDIAIAEIRQVRQKLSARLWKALKEDRFLEELRKIGREGRRGFKKKHSSNGHRNGHP